MLDYLFAAGQFVCLIGYVYGAYLVIRYGEDLRTREDLPDRWNPPRGRGRQAHDRLSAAVSEMDYLGAIRPSGLRPERPAGAAAGNDASEYPIAARSQARS